MRDKGSFSILKEFTPWHIAISTWKDCMLGTRLYVHTPMHDLCVQCMRGYYAMYGEGSK